MLIFVDNINFKNENNFKSLFTYIKLNNIKYHKNKFGDHGLKKAQGDYSKFRNNLPKVNYSKEEIFDNYWNLFRDELLQSLLKKKELYLSNTLADDKEVFDLIYLHYYNELEDNLRAAIFWLQYWKKNLNHSNVYICFSNTLIYTKTLSKLLMKYQIPLYVVEHFATGNDFYFDKRYSHIPNNINASSIEFSIEKYSQALHRFENWNNKNVKQSISPKRSFFDTPNTFLLSTQVVNDFSIISTRRKYLSIINYYKIIIDKVMKETISNLIIKTHPYEKVKNGKAITFDVLDEYIHKVHNKSMHRIKIVENYNLDVIIDNIECAIVFNSQIAFEVANKSKPIITLGKPFYKDYFTIDKEIDNFELMNANEYSFHAEKYKHYLVNLMEYLFNNNDLEKINNELSQYKLELNDLSSKNNNVHNSKKVTKNNLEDFIIKNFTNEKNYKKYRNKRDLFYHDINSVKGKILRFFFYKNKRI